MRPKSIILIGFKHVGKTVIGRALADQLKWPFRDLDEAIEQLFTKETQAHKTCRQIMKAHGSAYFRELEKRTLVQVMQTGPLIHALGGGAPLEKDIQHVIKKHTLIHITAPREVVFNRIMMQGCPAFFPEGEAPLTTFHRLWEERAEIYKKLADFSIENKGLIASAVTQILRKYQHA